MSFWSTEETQSTGEFEQGGGEIEVIPAGTQVKAAIDEASVKEWQGDNHIELRWNILAPDDYKGRKIFHKVRVFDVDGAKKERAKKMLAAIAVNAGGGLLKIKSDPTDADLQKHLMHKPMALLLDVWDVEGKEGNWVKAVSPLKSKSKPVEQPKPQPAVDDDLDIDDDLPF